MPRILTEAEEAVLRKFKDCPDPEAKYFPDGHGKYLNIFDIEREIRADTEFGRELLRALMALEAK